MICDRFKSRVLDFALGADDAEFRAHLNGCASCRTQLETQRALLASMDRGVASMVQGEPSGDFAAHVRRRIAEQALAPRPWFAGWVPVAAAALALIVLGTFWMIRSVPAVPEQTSQKPPAQTARPPREPQMAREAPTVSVPAIAGNLRAIRQPRPGQMAANREPEVLVPRGEMAAVMRLFNANWSGKADGASLTAPATPVSETLKPLSITELRIPVLEVVPLEGGTQPKRPSENR